MKKWSILLLMFALMATLIACGTSNEKSSNKAEEPIQVSEDEIASGQLEIVASNWKFDKEYYAVRAGEEIELNVNSIEGVHGIEIVGTDYVNIVNNKPTSVSISEPGTYTIRCSVPCGIGHRSMTAKLVVV